MRLHLEVKPFTEHPAVGGKGAVGRQHMKHLATEMEEGGIVLPCLYCSKTFQWGEPRVVGRQWSSMLTKMRRREGEREPAG